jgi:hypothetical protein
MRWLIGLGPQNKGIFANADPVSQPKGRWPKRREKYGKKIIEE